MNVSETSKQIRGTERFNGVRVLLLFPHAVAPGGGLNYTLKLAELLMRQGAAVGMVALRADRGKCEIPAGVELLIVDGPLTSELKYWLLLPYWQRKVDRRIGAWRPDVIVPQVFPSNWWAWLYKRAHPEARVIWVCHEPSAFIHSADWIRALQPTWKSWLARLLQPILARIDRSLSQNSDRIVANSRFTGAMVERVYRRTPDAVAYPAIDHGAFFVDPPRERRGIITVAKLSRFKRVDCLLRVFSRVLERQPELVYHIVGTGEDEAALKALARDLKCADRVIFHGSVDQPTLAGLYRQSLLFLHGAVAEPFGMAPLEAIACGTPVIAHDSGGPREFVNASCGRLIGSLAEEEWSEAVAAFLAMLQRTPSYFSGVAGNAERFAWETTLQPLVEVIGEAVNGREQGTGNREQGTGNREQGTGNRP